ncbi:hypothetical protein HK099_002203 [Clydaea vesicula]|uniref:Uncharacterized protein n=1 Tax=Clydaea vesicula TaxID=447962 RepID=A0AAD5Y1H9_9FUNG|nr:hypothetical protein HK099_002203 [Clydaea vesicula]
MAIEVDNNRLDTSTPTTNDAVFVVSQPESSTQQKKRYCWGKLSKIQFVITITLLTFIFIVALGFAIGFLVILPNFVPKIVYHFLFESDLKELHINSLSVHKVDDKGIYLGADVDTPWKLPISFADAELQPMTLSFKSEKNNEDLFDIAVRDKIYMNGWDKTHLALNNVDILVKNPTNMGVFLNNLGTWLLSENATVENAPDRLVITGTGSSKVLGMMVNNCNFNRVQNLEFIAKLMAKGAFAGFNFNALNTELGALGGEKSDSAIAAGPVLIDQIDVNVDAKGISVKADGHFVKRSPINLEFGKINVGINLGSEAQLASVASLQVNGIKLSEHDPNFKLDVSLIPKIGDAQIVSKAVGSLLAGQYDGIYAGVSDIFIQGPNNVVIPWLDTALSQINIKVPLKSFQEKLMTMSNPSSAGSLLGDLAINDLSVAMAVNNTINIQPNITIPAFLKAKVNVMPFTAAISDDNGVKLIDLSLGAISLTGSGPQTLAPPIKLVLNPAPEAAAALGKVGQNLISVQPAYLSVGKIEFQSLAGKADNLSGLNQMFSVLRIRIPLLKLVDKSPGPKFLIAPGNSKATENDAKALPPKILLSLIGGGISATGNSIIIKLDSTLASLLPVQASIPYLALRLGLDKIEDAVKVELTGLALKKGSHALNNTLEITFGSNNQLPPKFANIINSFLKKEEIKTDIVIGGLRFGPSKPDSYGLLDNLNIVIKPITLKTLTAVLAAPPAPGAVPKAPLFKFNLPPSIADFKADAIATTLNPVLQSLDISTEASKSLKLGTSLSFTNPFPLSLDVPYVGLDLSIDGDKLLRVGIAGLKAEKSSPNTNQIVVTLGFVDSFPSATITKVVGNIKAGNGIKGLGLGIKGIALGLDPSKSIKALSELEVKVGSNGPSLDFAKMVPWLTKDLLQKFQLAVASVEVNAVANGLQVVAGVNLNNVAPLTVNIGVLNLGVSLTSTKLVTVGISNIKIVRGPQLAALSASVTFGRDAALKEKVKDLVDKVLNKRLALIEIGGISLGHSANDRITAFEQLTLPFPLPELNLGSLGGSSGGSSGLLKMLNKADVTAVPDGLNVALGINFAGAPFNVVVRNLYVSLDVFLQNARILGVSINNINMSAGRAAQVLNLPIGLAISKDPSVARSLAGLINPIFQGRPANLALAIRGLKFGSSPSNMFDFASLAELSFQLPLPAMDVKSLFNKGSSSQSGGITSLLKKVDVTAVAKGLNVGLGLAFPGVGFELNVHSLFLSVDLFMEKVRLVQVALDNLNVAAKDAQILALAIAVNFAPEASNAAQTVATYLNPILAGRPDVLPLSITGLRFGSSHATMLDLLSLIEIPLPLDPSSLLSGISGGGAGKPGLKDLLKKVDVTAVPKGLSVGLALDNLNIAAKDAQILALAIALDFAPEAADAAQTVATYVNPILAGKPSKLPLSISGLRFGSSPSTMLNLLSLVKIPLPLDPSSLLSGISGGGAGKPGLKDLLKKVDVTAVPKGLSVGLGLAFPGVGFELNVRSLFLSVELFMEKVRLVHVALDNLNIAAKDAQILALAIALDFAPEAADAAQTVATYVNPILAGKPSKLPLSISGLRFGSSPSTMLNLLSLVKIPLPLDPSSLLSGISGGGAGKPGLKDLLKKVDVTAVPKGLSVGLGLAFPGVGFELNVRSLFLSVELFMQNVRLVDVGIDNINITAKDPQVLALPVAVNFAPEAEKIAETVANAVNPILAGNGGTIPLTISGLRFGSSAAAMFNFLSLVKVPLPVNPGNILSGIGGSTPEGGLMSLLRKLDVTAVPKGLSVGLGLAFPGVGFELNLKSLFVSLDVLLDKIRLVQIGLDNVNVNATGAQVLSLPFALNFAPEAQNVAQNVAGIVNPIFAKLTNNTVLPVGISGLRFGSSPETMFNLLSLVRVPLPVNVKPILDKLGGSSGGPGLDFKKILALIKSVDVATVESGIKLGLGVALPGVGFELNLKSFFFEIEIILNRIRLLQIALANVNVAAKDAQILTLPIGLNLAPEDPKIAEMVAAVVQPIINGDFSKTFFAGIKGLKFGSSKSTLFTLFSLIEINLPIKSEIFQTIGGGATESALALPKITSLTGGFLPDVSMEVNVGLQLTTPLPFAVTANIGYLGVDIQFGAYKVATLSVSGTTVNGAGAIGTSLKVAFYNNAENELEARSFVSCFIAPLLGPGAGCENHRINIKNIRIGHTSSQNFVFLSLLSKELLVDIRDVLKLASGGSSGSAIGFTNGDITLSETGVSIAGDLTLNLDFNVNLNLGYLNLLLIHNTGLSTGTAGSPTTMLVNVVVENLVISNSSPQRIGATINMGTTPYWQEIAGSLLKKVDIPMSYALYNFRFGKDAASAVTLFSKVPIFVPYIQQILKKLAKPDAPKKPLPFGALFSGEEEFGFMLTYLLEGQYSTVLLHVWNAATFNINLGQVSINILDALPTGLFSRIHPVRVGNYVNNYIPEQKLNLLSQEGCSSNCNRTSSIAIMLGPSGVIGSDVIKDKPAGTPGFDGDWFQSLLEPYLSGGLSGVLDLAKTLVIDSPAISNCPWVTDSFKNFRIPIAGFLPAGGSGNARTAVNNSTATVTSASAASSATSNVIPTATASAIARKVRRN